MNKHLLKLKIERIICTGLIFVLMYPINEVFSQKVDKKYHLNSKIVNGLKFRSIGPALKAGRIADIAVNPSNHVEYYVAVASGGIWKTVNSGTTWIPVFDGQSSYSIGCIAIDPNNHHTIWAGTGENNSQRSVSFGDGIYKSLDGGKSWKNMGLNNSEHIGKILIDPRNSNIVYAAAQGPLWGPAGDRGLYKTLDGGKTWDPILTISENTGITDIAFDPRNPDVIYAASYQRRRRVWTLINGGPESAIYKSTDAGKNWKKLTKGLPGVEMGRIGLAVSPANPDVVYAIIEAADDKGGFFRSLNRGENWEKRNAYKTVSAQYYQEIFADPNNVERVYSLDTYTKVTEDGGKTFKVLNVKNRHVDDHALWIDPDNTDHLLIGGDGGVYETWERGANWQFKANLPITQFYRVAVDNSFPFYYVYGGTQDNNTLGGPSRTTNIAGIVNSDWFVTKGGDGFETQVDPEDPNIVYSQSQYGWLVRYDKKTGESIIIKPQESKDDDPLRWNWDSPFIISPHNHKRLYFAANKLFRSDDMGNTWQVISTDLTRQIDRNKLEVMGKVWSVDAVAKNASTSLYGNIVALSESPLKEGQLYAGTDDGLINITTDGGLTWRMVENFPEIPEKTYVSFIFSSQHNENVVYASFDNHKNNDFNPYLLKSSDAGKSWVNISGDLPKKEIIYSIAEDHINPDLIFIGTEFGVFFTINGGTNWIKLKGGLPTIAVKDIAIQKRENDLVLGTFGRSFYILDDYSALRDLTEERLKQESYIFPVKDALMYLPYKPLGGRGKASQGDAYFTAKNPDIGAIITYYYSDSLPSKKQIRKALEKESITKEEPIYYPSFDELREEDNEKKPFLIFTISDDNGNVIRNLRAKPAIGINRITWDFRYPSARPVNKPSDKKENGYNRNVGFPVLPGKYTVSMSKSVNGEITKLAGPVQFNAIRLYETEEKNNENLVSFQLDVSELQRAVTGTSKLIEEIKWKLSLLKEAAYETLEVTNELNSKINDIEKIVMELSLQLNDDQTLSKRNENFLPSISSRLNTIIYGLWNTSSGPTNTQIDQYEIIKIQMQSLLPKLEALLLKDIRNIEIQLEKAGAPWTPGRIPKL